MRRCTFCDILAGKLPSSVIWQDDLCIAFVDIQPVNPGHVLVIPNQHAANLADLDPDCGASGNRATFNDPSSRTQKCTATRVGPEA